VTLEHSRRRVGLVMSAGDIPPTGTLNIFAWVLAAVVVVLVSIPLLNAEAAKELAAAYTPKGEPQETPMDWCQEPLYAAALLICLAVVVRMWRRPERLPLWVLISFVTAGLLWRELPWDERVLGANTFSWARYLGRPEVPLWSRLVFGGGSILATGALVAYIIAKRRVLRRLVREKIISISSALFVLGGLLLVAAQGVDKHRTTDAILGTSLSTWALRDYLEESLEIIGPLLLVMACLMAAMEEFPGRRSDG